MRSRLLRAAVVVAGLLCLGVADTRAAGIVDGRYVGSVVLGPVLLDGRYPLTIGTSTPGTIDVTTSANGTLAARVGFAGMGEETVGRIAVTAKGVQLTLRGRIDEGRIGLTATLQGSEFVGTIKLGSKTQPCRIDVATVAPLRLRYDLALADAGNGAISGQGTVTVGSEVIAVVVRGSAKKILKLTVAGGGTTLKLRGAGIGAGALVAPKWSARGFGAVAKPGKPVRLLRQ